LDFIVSSGGKAGNFLLPPSTTINPGDVMSDGKFNWAPFFQKPQTAQELEAFFHGVWRQPDTGKVSSADGYLALTCTNTATNKKELVLIGFACKMYSKASELSAVLFEEDANKAFPWTIEKATEWQPRLKDFAVIHRLLLMIAPNRGSVYSALETKVLDRGFYTLIRKQTYQYDQKYQQKTDIPKKDEKKKKLWKCPLV